MRYDNRRWDKKVLIHEYECVWISTNDVLHIVSADIVLLFPDDGGLYIYNKVLGSFVTFIHF